MLKQRVITAVILLAILLPALFYPAPEAFCAVTLLLIVAAGWEWGRLNGCSDTVARAAGAALGVLLALVWWLWGLEVQVPWLWPVASLLWLALTPWLLFKGVAGWPAVSPTLRLALGWVLIGVAWWAMAQARVLGVTMLLSIFLLVWVADIAAYFGGKTFGRRKLAPHISPGKSWEGAVSGWLGVVLLSVVWVAVSADDAGRNLYGVLWSWGSPVWAFAALCLLVTMSVAGDLVESLVKRGAGMKDSSQLLPGHGGVLDRVDALLPVFPLAMWMVTW